MTDRTQKLVWSAIFAGFLAATMFGDELRALHSQWLSAHAARNECAAGAQHASAVYGPYLQVARRAAH